MIGLSSMLFKVNSSSPIYSTPGGDIKSYAQGGQFIIITKIFLYNKTSNSYKQIGENDVPDEDLSSDEEKYLYADPGRYYINKKNVTYVQNFITDLKESLVINRSGVVKSNTKGLYGPNINSPVKKNIPTGISVRMVRQKDHWYLINLSGDNMWVSEMYITDTTQTSISNQNTKQEDTKKPSSRLNKNLSSYNNESEYNAESLIYNKNIKALIQSAGIYNRDEIEWYDKFSRYGYIDPYNVLTNTREYVFITKPDLHIFATQNSDSALNPELARMAIFQDAFQRYKPVLKQLQWSVDRRNPFMNLLSNSIKGSLDLPGISADEVNTSANIYGTKMTYRKASETSDESFDFSIEFEDTKYLEVYMLFKLFDEYEKRKLWGDITPPDINYIYRKILHDQVSIYKFIVADDGMSLIYWAKLTGCYPKSVPRESFSSIGEDSSNSLRFSIQWHAQFVEDMDPQILSDFNTLIIPQYNNTTELPIYNNEINAIDGRWAVIPYIKKRDTPASTDGNVDFKYILGWRI